MLTPATTAQTTATRRTNINVAQQFRWHMVVDEGLAILRERNTGVSLVNGKSFGEVIDEFAWTGDETGLAASDGKLRVVGDKAIEKHEKRIGEEG